MASCTFEPGDLNSTGDIFYGLQSCHRPFIEWACDVFDFQRDDWNEGFGWSVPCDFRRPFGRTMSGIWCLAYSAEDFRNESYDSNILQWGCRFARSAIDELDARCGTEGTIAKTLWFPVLIDNWTELYLGFFEQSVPLRAGTLVHEARHADGKLHDRGDRDSSWGYNGAWRWQVCWLAWFVAAGTRTTPAMKRLARNRANNILNSKFSRDPGFNIG